MIGSLNPMDLPAVRAPAFNAGVGRPSGRHILSPELVSEIIFRKYLRDFLQSTMIVGAEITRRRFARGADSYEDTR